jgi:hypothetical protein
MEKDLGSWFNHQRTDCQPSSLSLRPPFNIGAQNTFHVNGISSGYAFPNFKPYQPNENLGWFYCVPRFRQGFSPVIDSGLSEKPNTEAPNENPKVDSVSNLGQKRFLIFDQSIDRTTVVFSSDIGGNVQYPPLNMLIQPPSLKDHFESKTGTFHHFVPTAYNQENENDDVRSEMQEDSDEIDALLYSEGDDDDEDYDCDDDDDEVASTGHSPSTMTTHRDKEGSGEESEIAKRRKLSSVGYGVPSLMDTASSVNTRRYLDSAENEESTCANSSDKKRRKMEKIRETLSVFKSIIPGGNDTEKDAIEVIDEAICYLRSLKVKAKELGFDDACYN